MMVSLEQLYEQILRGAHQGSKNELSILSIPTALATVRREPQDLVHHPLKHLMEYLAWSIYSFPITSIPVRPRTGRQLEGQRLTCIHTPPYDMYTSHTSPC